MMNLLRAKKSACLRRCGSKTTQSHISMLLGIFLPAPCNHAVFLALVTIHHEISGLTVLEDLKMAIILRDVLSYFGYKTWQQQSAIIQLLYYRGCFPEQETKEEFILNGSASKYADMPFDSLENGVSWLCDITQKKFLRATFQKEGIGREKDPVVNLERWKVIDDELNLFQRDAKDVELLSIFRALELVDAVEATLPHPSTLDHVVIHGGLEKFAKERVGFLKSYGLKDFSGNLYYMTNPRGLFNDEPSLAAILATWFGDTNLKPMIQTVLDKHKDPKASNKNWLKDLVGLKQEILAATGKIEWPTGKGWYYKNPEPFDKAATAESRQSLAGWPTAMDMIEHLVEQIKLEVPGHFTHISLIPIYSSRPNRVANTEDNIEDFYINHAQHFPANSYVVFISNNSLGLHYIPFQDVIARETLKKLNAQPLMIETVGPGSENICLSAATDVLAKIFYTKRPCVLKALHEGAAQQVSEASSSNFRR